MTKTVVEDETLSWTSSELNVTDIDSDAGSLVWSASSVASNGTATVSGNGTLQLFLTNRMLTLMARIALKFKVMMNSQRYNHG